MSTENFISVVQNTIRVFKGNILIFKSSFFIFLYHDDKKFYAFNSNVQIIYCDPTSALSKFHSKLFLNWSSDNFVSEIRSHQIVSIHLGS